MKCGYIYSTYDILSQLSRCIQITYSCISCAQECSLTMWTHYSTLGSCYGIRKGTKVISVIVIISKNGMKGQHLIVSIISVIMLPYPNLWTLLGMLIMLWLLMDFVYMIKITRYCFIWWKSCWILSLIILMVITCMLILKQCIMKSDMWTQNQSSIVKIGQGWFWCVDIYIYLFFQKEKN